MSQSSIKPTRLPGTGWREDSEDRRDRALYKTIPDISKLPPTANVEHLMPPVMDQGVIGSCTGFSAANVAYAVMVKDGHRRPFVPSPVFLYREARVLGGYVEEDAGAEIRNVWKTLAKFGSPPMSNLKPRYKPGDLPDEQTWLFPENSIWRRQPAPSIYADAERRQMLQYNKLFVFEEMLQCLADGYPFNFGFPVFRSFYGPSGPLYDVPDPRPEAGDRSLGGHAVTAIGYDMASQRVLVRNQWGVDAHRNPGSAQGNANFTLTYKTMRLHASDAWTGRFLEGGKAAA